MEIERNTYLQQLIERKDNHMIKVITGILPMWKIFFTLYYFQKLSS